MIGKRELVARVMVHTGAMSLVGKLYNGLYKDVKILAYHRVLPKLDEATFPYDIELVSAWRDEFDWQMQYLARHFEVITCRELAQFVDSGKWPTRPCVLVTFDDGYLDNYEVALPVLQQHGLPAVMYVSTGYMGSDDVFWYDRLAFDVLHAQASSLELAPGGRVIQIPSGLEGRRMALMELLRYLKTISNPVRIETLVHWREALRVSAQPDASGLHRPMNWDQVKALSDAGIEIGSHTVTHPVLSRVSDQAELELELMASKAAIEACTGKPVMSIAYPTGGHSSYTDRVVDCVKRAGYRFAFTYESGVNQPLSWDPYRLRRSAIERYVSRERFQALLAAPGLFS